MFGTTFAGMRSYPIRVPRILHFFLPEVQFTLSADFNNSYALSFDDGPNPESTPQLLRLLDDMRMKVRFFLLGNQAALYPSLLNEIRSAGHTIGSHGYNHLNGWTTSDQVYIDDTLRSCELLETDVFRPPFGKLTRSQYVKLKPHYQIYLWSVMPGDFDTSVDSTLLYTRMRKSIRNRDIIVLHDTPQAYGKMQEILPLLAQDLSQKVLHHVRL